MLVIHVQPWEIYFFKKFHYLKQSLPNTDNAELHLSLHDRTDIVGVRGGI